jgi:hypothetical protein
MLNASEFIFKGVVIPKYDDKQKLTSLLKSREAVYRGRKTEMKDVSLEIYDKEVMKIKSPKGIYDSAKKKITGRSPIDISDPDLKITGKVWEVDLETKEIKIFSDLNIELTKDGVLK